MDSYEALISSYGMTTQEGAAAMGIFGMLAGMVMTFLIVALVIYVLLIIAWWKIFTKAGEKGWKSIIPFYNLYILCKIIGLSFWKWFIAIVALSLLASVLATPVPVLGTILYIAYAVVVIVFYALMARNTAKAFGKGTGFAVGLFFLPNIFELILGFGSAEYKGVPTKE